MTRYLPLAAFALLQLVGCASFSTEMIHRSEDNTYWKREKLLRGVPVTLKVPTHVRIDVVEKHYLISNSTGVSRKKPAFPVRAVNYTPIETEKMFVVDLKRPAAGTINANIKFDADNQYFTAIKTKVEDETIQAVGDLISAVAPGGLFGAPTKAGLGANFKDRVKEVSSVVASRVFEFDAPDFEIQVMAFLSRHLNCCHDCGVLSQGVPPPWELPLDADYPIVSREMAILPPVTIVPARQPHDLPLQAPASPTAPSDPAGARVDPAFEPLSGHDGGRVNTSAEGLGY